MAKKVWGIWSYAVGALSYGGWIESSIGLPYHELRRTARRMDRNGEGLRYLVRMTSLDAQLAAAAEHVAGLLAKEPE